MKIFSLDELGKMSFKISEDAVTRKNSDGSVILMKMSDGDIFYKIDGLSADIFKIMEDNSNLKEACESILQEYDVTQEILLEDVTNLINTLKEIDIVLCD